MPNCPKCNSTYYSNITYGKSKSLKAPREKTILKEKFEQNHIYDVNMGCQLPPNAPNYICIDCNHMWRDV